MPLVEVIVSDSTSPATLANEKLVICPPPAGTTADVSAVMVPGRQTSEVGPELRPPTVVLEALASGLPVVYSASGGTPELVGDDAGVGVPAPLDWEQDHPPAPEALAAMGVTAAKKIPKGGDPDTPIAEVLWQANKLAAKSYRFLGWLPGQ